ncbi:MAG: hypothetical protein QXT43_00705 [Candidatus Micrarchaeaceae archaeon]
MATRKPGAKEMAKAKHGLKVANPVRFFAFIAVLVIIVAAIVYEFAQLSSVILINAQNNLQLKPGSAVLMKLQNGSMFALLVSNSNATGATVYISQLPLLASYASKIVLLKNQSANVSVSATGNADINVRLKSSNATAATLVVTPLSVALGVKVSKSVILNGPYSISSTGGLRVITISTTSTTSTTTSTVNQTAALLESALNYANTKTSEGILMEEYKSLYNKGTVCNESIYNATYMHYYSVLPSGSASFYNISRLTPINITVHAAISSGDLVFVNYTPVFRNGTTGASMLSLLLNMSAGAVAPIAKLTYGGILAYANYAELNSTYAFQSSINNYCGAYIEPPA